MISDPYRYRVAIQDFQEARQRPGYERDLSQPEWDGYKRGHVYDPFGNRIELMEKI